MKKALNTSAGWAMPAGEPIADNREGRTEYDIDRWHKLTTQVRDAADRHNWSRAEVAKRSDVSSATFSLWYAGKYEGRYDHVNKKIAIWIEALEEAGGFADRMVQEPTFVKTRTSEEFSNTLAFAQQTGGFVIITSAAGTGKTCTFRQFQRTRPHVFLATISPHTRTTHGMLVEIAASIGLTQHNPAKLARGIGEFLAKSQSPTLLIIDEAQNLEDRAIDQLRYFCDIYDVGVALGGNTEVYGRFSARSDGPSYAQIKRRVAKRIKRTRSYAEDIDLYLDAWNVNDDEIRKYLHGIGTKDGALGSIRTTLIFAHLIATGDNEVLTLNHVKAAWRERDLDGV